jgi:hypothetical protein
MDTFVYFFCLSDHCTASPIGLLFTAQPLLCHQQTIEHMGSRTTMEGKLTKTHYAYLSFLELQILKPRKLNQVHEENKLPYRVLEQSR